MLDPPPPLDDDLDSGLKSTIPISGTSRQHLEQTARWAQVLAITNIISASLQVLSMFILLDRVRAVLSFFPVEGNNYMLALIIMNMIFITFTGLLGWQLWNYGANLRLALHFDDTEKLDLSFYYQYRYFKTFGWMVIASMAMVLLGILLFIYTYETNVPSY